ncbi:hypothetical protein U1Q18_010410 [Sarracenia purpurea var. burkii]
MAGSAFNTRATVDDITPPTVLRPVKEKVRSYYEGEIALTVFRPTHQTNHSGRLPSGFEIKRRSHPDQPLGSAIRAQPISQI